MELNRYQELAMITCRASCKNEVYAVNGMQAEVGEIADKIAKWVRSGIVQVDGCRLVWNTSSEEVVAEYRKALALELGDVLWFVALLATQLDRSLEEVAQMNIEKLRDRALRGKIDGDGDNR